MSRFIYMVGRDDGHVCHMALMNEQNCNVSNSRVGISKLTKTKKKILNEMGIITKNWWY